MLRGEVSVPVPVSQAFAAWTTDKGLESFFARKAKVDLRIDGTYDVWFMPDKPAGLRGAEGMRILDLEPNKRFAFTWNAPPAFPTMRNRRTMVVLDFVAESPGSTKVRFTHLGWGDGPECDEIYNYFDQAWGQIVLPYYVHLFVVGPVDWKKPPKLQEQWTSLKRTLTAAEK